VGNGEDWSGSCLGAFLLFRPQSILPTATLAIGE